MNLSFFKKYQAFTPLITFAIVLLVGLIWASYKDLEKRNQEVLGLGDTINTWVFSSGTASNYTYDTNVVEIGDNGATVLADLTLFTNSGFESDISNWTLEIDGVDQDAQTYWDAMTTEPSQGRKVLDNELFLGLKSDNIWNKLDEMWLFTQETEQAALLGVKRYRDATNVGATQFHVNSGFQRQDSTTRYINTNFIASTHGVRYLTNDSSFGVYSRTNQTQNGYDMGAANGGSQVSYISARWGDNLGYIRINQNDLSGGGANPGNTIGLFVARRDSSSTSQLIKDGTVILNRNAVSSGLPGNSFTVTGINSTGTPGELASRRYALAFVGGSMTLTEQADFSTHVNAYINQIDADYQEILALQQSGITYNSSLGAAEISAEKYDHNFYQMVDTNQNGEYVLSGYVYTDGTAVTNADAELFYNGSAIVTTYTAVGGGWYRLSAIVDSVDESRSYGVQVKADQTAYVDQVQLYPAGGYSLYLTGSYTNSTIVNWNTFAESSNVGSGAQIRYQLCNDDGSTCESEGSWLYWNGSSWVTASNITTHTNSASELLDAVMELFPTAGGKISVKAIFTLSSTSIPELNSIDVSLTTDGDNPTTNASNIELYRTNGGLEIDPEGWANNPAPYFSWTAGADNEGGSGLRGYCLYLGQDSAGDPATSKGLLGSSPITTSGTTCGFIIASNAVDYATLAYRGDPWLVTDTLPYYLNIKAVDNAGNIFAGSSAQFQFYYDDTPPVNVAFINPAAGNFNSIADMNFSWPTNGASASSDVGAGLLGWQYSINGTTDWVGPSHSDLFNVDYIPTGYSQPHFLSEETDGENIVTGTNVLYFRTVDQAGNTSLPSTYRTGSLSFGGNAPVFPGDGVVTVNPSTSSENLFALSWPEASPGDGLTINSYYYMINTTPPANLATLTGNSATYRPTTATSVSAQLLTGVQRGSNTVNVVAVDNEGNYSPSNFITGSFILDSSNPDPAINLSVSDASIKAISLWRAAIAWDPPQYQGTGILTYLVQRSEDGMAWETVANTTGTAYVDTVTESKQYYWRVGTQDTSDLSIASPSYTNAVALIPRGSYTEPPALTSQPVASSITTRKATITWTTSRTADSKVAFSTVSGEYNPEEPSNSAEVTQHIINLTNLEPGTTYYYVAKWTDEDGNTGVSDEKSFATDPAPVVTDPQVRQIGLSSAILQYTVAGASSVKIYYGTTPEFGGVKEVATSPVETTYTSELSGLQDGTKYFYKINTLDSEGFEYQGSTLTFETLPRPRITNVRLQQISNRSQSTVLVSWETNTETSAIVTYYPTNNPADAKDQVEVELMSGAREMIVSGLLPSEAYTLQVSGIDKAGNRADSDLQNFTTAADTRPPQISGLRVAGNLTSQSGNVDTSAQLIISWNTDEPATSQVEFGEGTGTAYAQTTQEDGKLSQNHTVVISGLTPSKIYHLRAISKDFAGNETRSVDTVTVAPKSSKSALELVLGGLGDIFGFILPDN